MFHITHYVVSGSIGFKSVEWKCFFAEGLCTVKYTLYVYIMYWLGIYNDLGYIYVFLFCLIIIPNNCLLILISFHAFFKLNLYANQSANQNTHTTNKKKYIYIKKRRKVEGNRMHK